MPSKNSRKRKSAGGDKQSPPYEPETQQKNDKKSKKVHYAWTRGLVYRPTRPTSKNTMLFVCDVQENFRNVMPTFPEMLVHMRYVINSCRTLGMRVLVTEQNPFKPTVEDLKLPEDLEVVKKSQFSMVSTELVRDYDSPYFIPASIENVILVGIEAHVCILQTALDLACKGKRVFVVWNAIASQSQQDAELAKIRLQQTENVLFASAQSIVYELLGDAKHPSFKAVLRHTKQHVAELGELGK